MDDFRKIIYGALIAFVATIVVWVGFLTISSCGYTPSCLGVAPKVERTSIPTLIPATLPASVRFLVTFAPTQGAGTSSPSAVEGGPTEVAIARPSNPGGPGPAVDLTGNVDSGKQIFAANCVPCHAAEGKGGVTNSGSTDGTVPPLNPIDPSLISSDSKTYVTNLDLFLEHGSTPEGTSPTFSMPAWGDKKALTPQHIADVIAYVISLNPVTNTAATMAPTPFGGIDVARPSNPGGPGPAANLTGDVNSGKQVFAANCVPCHAAEGKGGNPNPGSDDGTIPALNPIDPSLISSDTKTYITNLDLFLEHGSTPSGPGPTFSMPAWGDKGKLQPQKIADVIAYIMSLNPPTQSNLNPPVIGTTAATPTAGSVVAATTAPSTPQAAGTSSGVPHPSNPGGPGQAISLTGDTNSGQQIFAANCVPCHAAEGKGGVANPGSTSGTVPALNPIDPALKNSDKTIFATNLDLFIEHGSTPEGNNPTFSMPAWGDKGALTPQHIADVIAYIISLNP